MATQNEYANIRAESHRERLSYSEMAKRIGIHQRTLARKLSRVTPFTLSEAIALRDTCFPDHTLEYLFMEDFCSAEQDYTKK